MITLLKGLMARLRTTRAKRATNVAFRRLTPIVVLAVCITALLMMFMWSGQASYKPLFGASERVNAAEMMEALDAAGVAYRLHPQTGQVLVPQQRLSEARMLLAAKGVVAKPPAGLELMDQKDPLGVSQFVQDVRFRRGLEGELSQSIMTLDAVDSARVHLSIARSTSFVVGDGEQSSASVVLRLKPGAELTNEQIAAIVNMVAGSVRGLDPARVSLIDQAGSFLSARVDPAEKLGSQAAADAARRYENNTYRNLRNLLGPVLGEENFKASVTAEVDNDHISETHEKYGDAPRVLSEALREELDSDPLALGVPGSLSNRPIAAAAGAQQTQNAASDGAQEQSTAQRNAATRQYAYDRSITQVERSRGRLEKLSVAVVLNNAAAPAGAGRWSPEQLAEIDALLRGGLGIDAQRGDTLVVSAMSFPARAPSLSPWWQERGYVIDYGGLLLKALVVLLIFLLVVRPLLRAVTQRLAPRPIEAIAAQQSAALPGAQPAEPAAVTHAQPAHAAIPAAALLESYDLPAPGSAVDVMVDHLKALAAKEPERVAEVVKQWVQKNVRSE